MTTNTTPKTWTVGELVTAAMLNEQIRDNMNARWPFTTKGDLAVATGSADLTRLPVGSDYKVLTALASEASGLKYLPLGSILQIIKQPNAISTDTTSTSYIDIPNATITVTLTVASMVVLLAGATITSAAGASEYVQAVLDGSAEAETINTIAAGQILQWSYLGSKACAPGSRVFKLRYKTNGNQVNFYNGNMVLIVLPTA